MAIINVDKLVLDARPDRLDLRDREYQPHLKSLPPSFPLTDDYLTNYYRDTLILEQGVEGACTGFGLAATINYLIWRDHIKVKEKDEKELEETAEKVEKLRVSERMLYQLARVYDEWEGEDYSGSSCRGAMKGWHRHGVCKKRLWGYDVSGKFLEPIENETESWFEDAMSNPLGAYYRINHESVVDMQAAIVEVGAIYCSARVHAGWATENHKTMRLIKQKDKTLGGHAFCIIGYNDKGFIVQNSWGSDWAYNGFAILSYKDWVDNGNDAWVVSRGVPLDNTSSPTMFANNPLQNISINQTNPAQVGFYKALKYSYPSTYTAKPWSENEAYEHTLVIGNNGRPKHKVISKEGPDQSAEYICRDNLEKWLQASPKNRKIAIYAHGGLNSEELSINRVRVMAPYFKENGVYPLFIVWKTGLTETLSSIIKESLTGLFKKDPDYQERAEGLSDWVSEKTDRAIESIARKVHAKSLWSEMKENAVCASENSVPGFGRDMKSKPGGMVILAKCLKGLRKTYPDIEINMIGHSAGAILLGEWLKVLVKQKINIKTVSLYAPACSIEFANKTYKYAIEKKVLDKKNLYIHNLDEEREQADNVVIYRKSLLYLVSRSLESLHKMPLLGLDAAWDPEKVEEKKSGGFHASQKKEIETWAKFIDDGNNPKLYTRRQSRVKVSLKPDYIKLSHGSFDNDIAVIESTIRKIKGGSLKVKIHNLAGY